MFSRNHYLICFFIFYRSLLSQHYPVSASVLLHPPFAAYLTDFHSSDAKMSLILTLNDYSLSSYAVKLKFTLTTQGFKIKSKDYYFAGPFVLTPGLPLLIEGDQFDELLSSQNILVEGLENQGNTNDLVLPEGEYEFLFEVYDYNSLSPVKVSLDASAKDWFLLYEPPLLTSPVDQANLNYSPLPSILFSWSPRHFGSLQSGTTVRYRFELWHKFSASLDVNALVNGVSPIVSFDSDDPIFTYTEQFPPLLNGQEYVWRIKAFVVNGPDLFKNNGYSPLHTFHYGSIYSNLDLDLNLRVSLLGSLKAKLIGDSLSIAEYYQFQFRKQGTGMPWQSRELTHHQLVLSGLEAGAVYEARLRLALPENNFSEWSTTIQFTMENQRSFTCEDVPFVNESDVFKPLLIAFVGMDFLVGLFPLRITQLKNTTSPLGIYSGKGILQFPFSVSLICQFDNVKINEEQKMVFGNVTACSEGIANWMNEWLNENLSNQTFSYSGSADSIHILPNGNCIIYGSNGPDTLNPASYPFVFYDSNGDAFQVMANGQFTSMASSDINSLSEEVKRVYRQAVLKLRIEYTMQKVDSLRLLKEKISTDFVRLVGQNNNIQIDESADFNQVIVYSPKIEKSQTITSTVFNEAELKYIVAQVIYYFSNKTMRQWDYMLLANGLEIAGQKSPEYITENFKVGIPESQTVNECASALLTFIEKVVSKKIYGE